MPFTETYINLYCYHMSFHDHTGIVGVLIRMDVLLWLWWGLISYGDLLVWSNSFFMLLRQATSPAHLLQLGKENSDMYPYFLSLFSEMVSSSSCYLTKTP